MSGEQEMGERKPAGAGTRAVWAGEQGPLWEDATQVPVVHSVSFGYEDLDQWLAVARGEREGHVYSRNTNPTVRAFEEKVAGLEGAPAAVSFASGMAAINDSFFALLSPGERVVSIKDTYGGTNRLLRELLPRFGVKVELCDTTDHAALEAAIAAGCRMLYLESPTNPTLKLVDIARLASAAHAVGALVVVDNTFATPLNQDPLALGADLVLHSATKVLGGHADALGGVVCGERELVEQIFRFREITGAVLDPAAAYLLLRGIKTLQLRVERQNQSSLRIARHLEGHPAVARVFHPGLESHPQHELARRQMSGFGGIFSFELQGGFEALRPFLAALRYAHRAANLGAVETVVGPPATTSHVECTPKERAAMGIPENLLRYSVGIEDVEDLIEDLDQSLAVL